MLGALGLTAPAAAQGNPWRLTLSVSESYHTNVRLSSEQQNAFATRFSVRLSRTFQGPRSQLGLSSSGLKSFYHGRARPRPGGIFYTVGVQFGYQLSDRASFSLQDNFRSSFTGELLDFVQSDEDVVLPLAQQKRNHVRAMLGFQVSPLTSVSLAATHDVALFQQDEITQPRLTNGDRISGGVGLSRKLSDVSSATLNYTFANSDQRLSSTKSHSVSLGFSRILGEFTNAGVSIGGSRRDSRDGRPNYVLNGGASIGRQFEKFSLNLSYRRNLGALFGFGREVVHNTFRLSHRSQLTRSLGIAVSGSHSRSRDPDDPSFSYNGWAASAGFNLDLIRSLQLHTGYHFAKRSPLPGETGRRFQSHRASLQLGWNTSF